MTAHARRIRRDDGSASVAVIIIGVLVALLVIPFLFATVGSSGQSSAAGTGTPAGAPQPVPSAVARATIPRSYLAMFQQAGLKYGIPWPVLAGIGYAESDFGADDGPSSAGALGPMQFLWSTWQQYGDGGDIMNPADAIPAAARLLLASGAPGNIPAAIFAYNHSADYVSEVLSQADMYAAGGYTVSSAQQGNFHLAAVRQAPSAIAAQIISYAIAQIGKPYIWGGTGPSGFDCSGLIYAAYRSVGITLPRTTFGMWDLAPHVPEQDAEPGDIVFFNMGPGTAPDHPGHAGLVIGNGQMVIANCTNCGTIRTASYASYPALVGFVRPLADPAITAQLGHP
jgi:cell wall-associated NlpC family hydrolase